MRIPRATYRFQFNKDFQFNQAKELVGYLSDLGISDVYASPIFTARQGSIHGYDVVDPMAINPEIGTEEEFRELSRELQTRQMGWIQDIVPNHMAFDSQNRFLMDVFENGKASEFYDFFDIEWDHAYESMKGRLLSPFLGKPYAESLESGEIKIQYSEAGFSVHYFGLVFPLSIESYYRILTPNANALRKKLGLEHPDFIKFMGVQHMLRAFPGQELTGADRQTQLRFVKRMLWELYEGNQEIKKFIDRNLDELNGDRRSKDLNLLDSILYDQCFRLAYWKVASEEINYRRFFSINELISLRMRDMNVFERCHELILKLVKEGVFTGLRIDHIDGLYDPLQYLQRLQQATDGTYVVVEKILAMDEDLPPNWPAQGTSGYEYMNYVNGIFCQKKNRREFDRLYASFTGDRLDYEGLIYEKKGIIVERFMTGDVDNLAHLMKRISSRDRGGGDITLYGLRRAIYEALGFFPIYRTYISPDSFTDMDRHYINEAIERAKAHNPDLFNELNYLRKFLMLDYEDYLGENEKREWLHFVMRFQQFTGPLMAKGFEDTTLYVYNRLISLNEVGGEPYAFGVSLDEFHEFNRKRTEQWPHAMSATATHDTKRGEDVRARINVLSEIPKEWDARAKAWRTMNQSRKKRINGMGIPSRNDEYSFYQTLLGAYPFDAEEVPNLKDRIKEYTIKAIREAKVYTGWIKPDADYEDAFLAFIDAVMEPSAENRFMEDFLPFQRKIAHYGMLNSLSQTLVKITSPGIPDFYQGSELWELSVVDPDNRRPVDYERRRNFLKKIQDRTKGADWMEELLRSPQDGRVKLFLIWRALQARTNHAGLFEMGTYVPLRAEGRFKEHVVTFARQEGSAWAVVIAPRFCTGLVNEGAIPIGADVWGDTRVVLPQGAPPHWQDQIASQVVETDGSIPVGTALSRFPSALLVSE